MAILKILKYPNATLKKVAEPVSDINNNVLQLIDNMVETMEDSSHGVGLAAPQVGRLLRIVTINVPVEKGGTGLIKLINPEIISKSKFKRVREGCLSVPNYLGTLKRAKKVTVKALNEKGDEVIIEGEGLLAVCLQHEIDHLDGILFLDRIINPTTDLIERAKS